MKEKRGSITLETAIALPLLLFVALCLLQYSSIVRVGLLIRNAADNAAAEAAMILAAADALGADDTLRNALEKGIKDTEIAGRILDAATVLVGGPFVRQRMLSWLYPKENPDASLKSLRNLEVYIEGALSGKEVYICVDFQVSTLLGQRTSSFEALLPILPNPFFGGGDLSDSDDIWSRDNLTRGRILRIRNGGNLPIGYPVISGFREGVALTIRSMDTTARTMQDEETVFREVSREIDALADFSGTKKPWGQSQVWIREEDITERQLLLVIPENPLEDTTENGITRAFAYAAQNGISATLSRQGRAYTASEG